MTAAESHATAELGVSGVQTATRAHRWNQCVTGRRAVSWEWPPRDSSRLSCSDSPCCVGHGESGRLRQTRSDFLCKYLSGGWCVIPTSGHTLPCFQCGRTLEPPVGGRSATLGSSPVRRHSQRRQCGAKPVRNWRCDGAYPRRERRGSAPVQPINGIDVHNPERGQSIRVNYLGVKPRGSRLARLIHRPEYISRPDALPPFSFALLVVHVE